MPSRSACWQAGHWAAARAGCCSSGSRVAAKRGAAGARTGRPGAALLRHSKLLGSDAAPEQRALGRWHWQQEAARLAPTHLIGQPRGVDSRHWGCCDRPVNAARVARASSAPAAWLAASVVCACFFLDLRSAAWRGWAARWAPIRRLRHRTQHGFHAGILVAPRGTAAEPSRCLGRAITPEAAWAGCEPCPALSPLPTNQVRRAWQLSCGCTTQEAGRDHAAAGRSGRGGNLGHAAVSRRPSRRAVCPGQGHAHGGTIAPHPSALCCPTGWAGARAARGDRSGGASGAGAATAHSHSQPAPRDDEVVAAAAVAGGQRGPGSAPSGLAGGWGEQIWVLGGACHDDAWAVDANGHVP